MSTTAILLRDATPADSPRLPPLLAQLGYPTSAEVVARRLAHADASGAARVLVAEADGRILGLAALAFFPLVHHDADLCRISAFVVDADARRGGIGRALVERLEAIAREHGCERIEVTSAGHREGAHRFYASLGYRERSKHFRKDLST